MRADGRVLILLRALSIGGAERQAATLATALHKRGVPVCVLCFYGGGPLEADLVAAGVRVHDVGKRSRWDFVGFVWRLVRDVRAFRPSVAYGFLNGPNLVLALLRPFWRQTRVVWGIRSTATDLQQEDRFVSVVHRLENLVSPLADAVICNSVAGRDDALARGLRARRVEVILNGIDSDRFCPSPTGGSGVREEWGIAADAEVVGAVGRLHAMKDLPAFVRATARLAETRPKLVAVIVGSDPESMGQGLVSLADSLGLAGRFSVRGPRDDVAEVMSALDVLVSTSTYGEGFSNVLAEAMACGTPVVATEVGDARTVVGTFGPVVPAGDVEAIAAGIETQLDRVAKDRRAVAADVRRHVVDEFGVDRMVDDTLAVLLDRRPTRRTWLRVAR